MILPPIIGVLGALVVSPRTGFRMIRAEKRGAGQGFLAMLITGLSLSCVFAATVGGLLSLIPGLESVTGFTTPVLVAMGAVVSVVDWLVASLLSHLFARLLGGSGSLEDAFCVIGFSYVVFFFVPLVTLLLAFIHPVIGIAVYALLVAVGVVWWLVVAGVGLSESHQVSTGVGVVSVLLARLVPILAGLFVGFALAG